MPCSDRSGFASGPASARRNGTGRSLLEELPAARLSEARLFAAPSSSPQLHLQSLHYVVDNWANGAVLYDPYESGSELAPVQVGERPAIIGTCLVDAAASIVEKAAWLVLKLISAPLLGQSEVLFDQSCFLEAEMIGESPDIPLGKEGRDDVTAVRAGATIDVRRNILQVSPDEVIEGDSRHVEALEICPETPVIVLLGFGQ